MTSQIDALRQQFNNYNNAQKKDFIEKLQAKLQGNKNIEYQKFLNECIQKYNELIRSGNLGNNHAKSGESRMTNCPDCGKNVSSRAAACPNCGAPIAGSMEVKINFPTIEGQLLNNNCFVYDKNGKEIVRCKQGETVVLTVDAPTTIKVKMGGCFGKPTQIINPGENYKVEVRGFGKIYMAKVDAIVGSSHWVYPTTF